MSPAFVIGATLILTALAMGAALWAVWPVIRISGVRK